MKEIIVKEENWERIESALEEVQKRVKVRRLDYADIYNALETIQKTLGIPKKYLEDVKVTIDVNAQEFPNAYKGIPESTIFRARFASGSWRITHVFRAKCRRPNQGAHVELTEAAKMKIIERMECFRI